jgi:hypothetical protein
MWQLTRGHKRHSKGSKKETKIQKFMYRSSTNVVHEVSDNNGNNSNQRNSNRRFKGKFGSRAKKTFSLFNTKDSFTRNMTHNTESTAF